MRRSILLSLLAAVVAAGCGLAGTGSARRPAVSASTLDAYVRQFRTTSGPAGLLGSYGKKRGDAAGHPFFRYGMLSWAKDNSVNVGRFRLTMDGLRAFASRLEGGGAGTAMVAREDSAGGTYDVSLVDVGDLSRLAAVLEDTMARDPWLRHYLADEDARIVTGIVLAHGSLRDGVTRQDSVTAGGVLGWKGTVTVGGTQRQSVDATITDAIVIGYRLVRICRDARGHIELVEDISGRGDDCHKLMRTPATP